MDVSDFERLAEETLDGLFEAIDAAIGDSVEVDFDNGILTIELEGGRQYVINKHAPTQELWVSSPLSGAAHYAYNPEAAAWVSTRGDAVLATVLAAELSEVSGQSVDLA